jgi:hypothetical protein
MPTGPRRPALPAAEVDTVLGCRPDEVVVESLFDPVASATQGVWRVRGPHRTVILKVLTPATGNRSEAWQAGTDPADPYYWRREADAYTSPLLVDPPPGLRPPTCYAVVDRPDSTALWLEDVAGGAHPTTWTDTDYERVGRALGRAQGAWAADPELGAPWLSRGWLRAYLDRHRADVELLDDPRVREDAMLREHLLPDVVARAAPALAEQDQLVDRLASLPRTLTHFDLSPDNVSLLDDRRDVVVIDWAFAGVEAIGIDAGTIAVDAALDFWLDPRRLGLITPRIADAYHAGLAEAGLAIDRKVVDGALAAAAVVKFGWILPALLRAVVDERPTLTGRPLVDAVPVWAAVATWLVDRAEVARRPGS